MTGTGWNLGPYVNQAANHAGVLFSRGEFRHAPFLTFAGGALLRSAHRPGDCAVRSFVEAQNEIAEVKTRTRCKSRNECGTPDFL
jgi:hypothetical protein